MQGVRTFAVNQSHLLSCRLPIDGRLHVFRGPVRENRAVCGTSGRFVEGEDGSCQTLLWTILKLRPDEYNLRAVEDYVQGYITGVVNLPNDAGRTAHAIPHDLRGEVHYETCLDWRDGFCWISGFEARVRS